MKILIVDDSEVERFLIESIVEDMELNSIPASSGEEALIQVALTDIDLAIIDIHMPGIDGFQTARQLREKQPEKKYPIIFVSADSGDELHEQWLLHGDDLIVKPVNSNAVEAKIRYHLKISELSRDLREKNKALQQYQDIIQSEHDAVGTIFEQQINRYLVDSPLLQYHMSPASAFNGDILMTEYGPTNDIVIAVGDVTGHGLASAVGALPIYPMFRTMVKKGIKVGTIAYEINRTLRSVLPAHMMLAAAIVEVNARQKKLEVWSGGMPELIVDDGWGNLKYLIQSEHMPLSALNSVEFSRSVSFYNVEPGDRLYLFTDGLHESTNIDGEMFGEGRLINAYDGQNHDMFDYVQKRLDEFSKGTDQEDDITLVEVLVPDGSDPDELAPVHTDPKLLENFSSWSVQVRLDEKDLKQTDPVAQVVNTLSSLNGCEIHADYLATIMTELFSNAFEHGVLGLDSVLKDGEDGFFVYYEARQQGLEKLDKASITIDLEFSPRADPPHIQIKVTDSGDGFDVDAYLSKTQDDNAMSFGRGISLIKELCESVEYSLGGREVRVTYLL